MPQFTIKTKDVLARAIKFILIGVLEHCTVHHRLSSFTVVEEFETGANPIIRTIRQFMCFHQNRDSLPRTLIFQMDKATRKNKNQYLEFLELLLGSRVFDELSVPFSRSELLTFISTSLSLAHVAGLWSHVAVTKAEIYD